MSPAGNGAFEGFWVKRRWGDQLRIESRPGALSLIPGPIWIDTERAGPRESTTRSRGPGFISQNLTPI